MGMPKKEGAGPEHGEMSFQGGRAMPPHCRLRYKGWGDMLHLNFMSGKRVKETLWYVGEQDQLETMPR